MTGKVGKKGSGVIAVFQGLTGNKATDCFFFFTADGRKGSAKLFRCRGVMCHGHLQKGLKMPFEKPAAPCWQSRRNVKAFSAKVGTGFAVRKCDKKTVFSKSGHRFCGSKMRQKNCFQQKWVPVLRFENATNESGKSFTANSGGLSPKGFAPLRGHDRAHQNHNSQPPKPTASSP